ncbi:hypothetical protein N9R81_01840 [Flavobacteriales bacterium]|nr:hypothetical protein [Flavobacteriales bacterium]
MRILLIVLLGFLFSPIQEMKIVSSRTVVANNFTSDNIGNMYFIDGNSIVKEQANGNTPNRYSNTAYGEIKHFDVLNPMQLLLYYPDLAKIVFLDNTLSVHHDVSLVNYELDQVSLVCSSVNSGFWVYDQLSMQLIRFNQQVHRIQETGNIVQILGMEINPTFLAESNNHVYLSDPEKGVFVFDIFGTYLKTIPIQGIKSFQVDEENLYYLQNGDVFAFNFIDLTVNKITLPLQQIEHFSIEKKTIYTLKDKLLTKYIIAP